MKKDNLIRDAIEESLSGVHFNAQDRRTVMRAIQNREPEASHAARPRRRIRADLAFSMALLLILVVPVTFFTLRVQNSRTTAIIAASGITSTSPQITFLPREDVIVAAPEAERSVAEIEAIRLTRECFEANCDTEIFSFEEYDVSAAADADGNTYTVTMTCVYGNGCRFVAVVSPSEGAVLQYSTPRLATVPTYFDSHAPEIQAWYEMYGAFAFTWAPETQAEFSRRYEGGSVRTAQEGELSYTDAQALALSASAEAFEAWGYSRSEDFRAYPMLYSERANGDGIARYVVYCFPQPVEDALPEACVMVTFLASDGSDLTVEPQSAMDALP